MNEGLVAPSWSDSGDVPVGEVAYMVDPFSELVAPCLRPVVYEFVQKNAGLFTKPSDPNAKPAMSALSKVAGESYRGLGWCDQ
jgi:hypothetical protein